MTAPSQVSSSTADFETLYDEHFEFVWRSVRRLGVTESAVDDVVQEVFVVVFRRLSDFEARSSVKTWLFGITLKVVRTHRRTAQRKGTEPLPEHHEVPDPADDPHSATERREGLRVLDSILDELDDDKRAVFVMAEIEQMSGPEIAEAAGLELNTVYSRLRAARKAFNEAVGRHRARDQRRTTS